MAVKRTLSNKINHKKNNKRKTIELKGSDTTFKIKEYFIHQFSISQCDVYAIVIDKQRVFEYLRDKKQKFYNYASRILIERINFPDNLRRVNLIVDKSKNKKQILDFDDYLRSQLESHLPLDTDLKIYHKKSSEEPGLQAVDLFCWGIWRKYAYTDIEWYSKFEQYVEGIYEFP